jgi:hypothetical protein
MPVVPLPKPARQWTGTVLLMAMLLAPAVPETSPGPTGDAANQAMPQAHAAPQNEPATGLILGRLVDADSGYPLAGAIVSAPMPSRPPVPGNPPARVDTLRVITAASGHFILRDLPPGPYNLTATLAGYSPGAYGRMRPDGPSRALQVHTGERVADVEIRLWRLAAISGRVVDEIGEPAVGVTVRAIRRVRSGTRMSWVPAQSAVTDDRGVYRLSGLTPGDYLVAVPATSTSVPVEAIDGYRQALADGRSSDLMRERLASRAPSPTISGVRLGTDVLQLTEAIGRRGLVPPQPTAGQPLYLYRTALHPAASSTGEATVVTVESGARREGIDIMMQLVPTARISGTVIGPDGPAAGIGVHVTPADMHAFGTSVTSLEAAITSTDALGRFTLLGVPAGAHVVSVLRVPRPPLPSGTVTTVTTNVGGITVTSGTTMSTGPTPAPAGPTFWARAPVSVSGEDVDDLRLELRTGITLSGEIVFDGTAPLPPPARLTAMTIRLAPTDAALPITIRPVRADAAGRFETAGYPPGRYTLQTGGSAGPGWSLKSVTIGGRDVTGDSFDLDADMGPVVITMTDRPSGLSGMVQGAVSPRALETATVVLIPADVRGWIDAGMPPGRARTTGARAGGQYDFANVLPGEYLAAALPGDVAVDLGDPDFVAAVARVGTRVTIGEGAQATQPLALAAIR